MKRRIMIGNYSKNIKIHYENEIHNFHEMKKV